MEAAWQFTSRALKILRLCWIQQAFLESLLHAGPYTRWSSLRCSCARSGKGSQPGSRHFPHSAGRCCASGKHGGHGAPQKAYQPRLEKGMPGSELKVVTQRKLVEGPSMELSSTGCCVSGTYQRRRGRAGCARSGPQPAGACWGCTFWSSTQNELDFSVVQSAPPRRFSPRAQAIHRLQF